MKTAAGLVLFLLGATFPQAEPFNGRDLNGWQLRGGDSPKSKWKVGKAKVDPKDPTRLIVDGAGTDLVNTGDGKGVDLYSELFHADCILEVEVLVPTGSNSGIYLMGEYEVQILDSHGKEKLGTGDMGGVTGVAAPTRNAAKPAGEWQKLVIDFRGPKFDGRGQRTHVAKFTRIELNGTVILRNVEVPKPTRGGLTGKAAPRGPLLLQGNHGPVAFRNLKIFGAAR